ncbi:hypothetical protein GWR56_13470 [Mucilaginibacter sp. 14171R-50]|uniref:hypothetical protein n=1 Tax=Mucilaginibacter sp. 14171R-50 TaxID=2703789 RepID=UPI00138D0023|nr:hypothetical protein [Mucilaginibacter sp. 14171R-50]QHS56497.1 hypothetical protein GWR56_13470 [Mucilaginibacter sp. 14171R-50]
MNKKRTNLLLGIAVIIIWGGAGYRVLSALGDQEELPVAAPSMVKSPADDFAAVTDTVQLRANYRDPFGLTPVAMKTDTQTYMKTIRGTTPVPHAQADMGFVKYAGYIANPVSKRTLSMLLINGKTMMLNEGESAEGIKVLKNMRDSVKVAYRGRVRFIVKSS